MTLCHCRHCGISFIYCIPFLCLVSYFLPSQRSDAIIVALVVIVALRISVSSSGWYNACVLFLFVFIRDIFVVRLRRNHVESLHSVVLSYLKNYCQSACYLALPTSFIIIQMTAQLHTLPYALLFTGLEILDVRIQQSLLKFVLLRSLNPLLETVLSPRAIPCYSLLSRFCFVSTKPTTSVFYCSSATLALNIVKVFNVPDPLTTRSLFVLIREPGPLLSFCTLFCLLTDPIYLKLCRARSLSRWGLSTRLPFNRFFCVFI